MTINREWRALAATTQQLMTTVLDIVVKKFDGRPGRWRNVGSSVFFKHFLTVARSNHGRSPTARTQRFLPHSVHRLANILAYIWFALAGGHIVLAQSSYL